MQATITKIMSHLNTLLIAAKTPERFCAAEQTDDGIQFFTDQGHQVFFLLAYCATDVDIADALSTLTPSEVVAGLYE